MKQLLFSYCVISLICFNIERSIAQNTIAIIAGNGTVGLTGDGGPATSASFWSTQGLCADKDGNLYIMDVGNARVRRIDRSGIITTVVGTVPGFSGDNGPATAAKIQAYGLSCDLDGNLLIGDWKNHRVRKVEIKSGIITTIAGGGTSVVPDVPQGIRNQK